LSVQRFREKINGFTREDKGKQDEKIQRRSISLIGNCIDSTKSNPEASEAAMAEANE